MIAMSLSGADALAAPPAPIPFADLRAGGELEQRLERNFNRLEEEKYQPDHIFLTLEQSNNWPGDTEGRTILGLVLQAQATHRAPKYLDEILNRFPTKVNEKGFFGDIPEPGTADEQQLSSHGWVLRGLCEYYLWKKDERVLGWIHRIIDGLVLPTAGLHAQYPIDPSQRVHGGGASGSHARQIGPWLLSTDIGCDFIFLDGVVQAYQVTKREDLRPVIEEMIARFLMIDLRAIKAQTHASLTAMRALMRYHEITGDPKLLAAVEERFKLYRDYGMTENYENYNWFGRPEWTEPCAVVDSYLLAIALWRHTGKADYLEFSERVYHNAFAFEQRANGGFGTQKCSGAGTPMVAVDCQEAHWCCTMRGAEGLTAAARAIAFTDDKGLFLVHCNPASVKAVFGDKGGLELEQATSYPNEGKVTLTVKGNTLDFQPVIRLFAPSWISDPVVSINGRQIQTRMENSFVCISEKLKAGDVITCDFPLQSGLWPLDGRDSTPGFWKLHYGPLLLATGAGSDPVLPASPVVRREPDGSFRVDGLDTVFHTVSHQLDPRVVEKPRYEARMLFKSAASKHHQ
jgi:hypothetical protein